MLEQGEEDAVVMLYNRYSARQLKRVVIPALLRHDHSAKEVRGMYNTNASRESAQRPTR